MDKLQKLEPINLKLDDNLKRLSMMIEGERIEWVRRSPQLRREITIYPETLTTEQQQRLNEIEKELVALADEATEETKTKTILKAQKGETA